MDCTDCDSCGQSLRWQRKGNGCVRVISSRVLFLKIHVSNRHFARSLRASQPLGQKRHGENTEREKPRYRAVHDPRYREKVVSSPLHFSPTASACTHLSKRRYESGCSTRVYCNPRQHIHSWICPSWRILAWKRLLVWGLVAGWLLLNSDEQAIFCGSGAGEAGVGLKRSLAYSLYFSFKRRSERSTRKMSHALQMLQRNDPQETEIHIYLDYENDDAAIAQALEQNQYVSRVWLHTTDRNADWDHLCRVLATHGSLVHFVLVDDSLPLMNRAPADRIRPILQAIQQNASVRVVEFRHNTLEARRSLFLPGYCCPCYRLDSQELYFDWGSTGCERRRGGTPTQYQYYNIEIGSFRGFSGSHLGGFGFKHLRAKFGHPASFFVGNNVECDKRSLGIIHWIDPTPGANWNPVLGTIIPSHCSRAHQWKDRHAYHIGPLPFPR